MGPPLVPQAAPALRKPAGQRFGGSGIRQGRGEGAPLPRPVSGPGVGRGGGPSPPAWGAPKEGRGEGACRRESRKTPSAVKPIIARQFGRAWVGRELEPDPVAHVGGEFVGVGALRAAGPAWEGLPSPNPAAARGRLQGETVLGPRLPLSSPMPLGEPGNGAGLAGPRSAAGPCLLQLPDMLSPQPLWPLPENPRNLAAPEVIQLLCRRAARSPTPPAALQAPGPLWAPGRGCSGAHPRAEHRRQYRDQAAAGQCCPGVFSAIPRTFGIAARCRMLVCAGLQRAGCHAG